MWNIHIDEEERSWITGGYFMKIMVLATWLSFGAFGINFYNIVIVRSYRGFKIELNMAIFRKFLLIIWFNSFKLIEINLVHHIAGSLSKWRAFIWNVVINKDSRQHIFIEPTVEISWLGSFGMYSKVFLILKFLHCLVYFLSYLLLLSFNSCIDFCLNDFIWLILHDWSQRSFLWTSHIIKIEPSCQRQFDLV